MKKSEEVRKTNIDLRYKRPKNGPEMELIKSFMENFENFSNIFEDGSLETKIFEEPYVGTSIPDIVIVFWDESMFNNWRDVRNSLEIRDIKILHHMCLSDEFVNADILKNTLGYSTREIEKTIGRLMDAGLIKEKSQNFRPNSLENIFFVKIIISIEAKIKNWKKAFEQAWLNEFFASESYVLLPQNRINSQVKEYAEELGVGLIGHKEKETHIIKKSIKKEIPSSYSSWLFNENIGRALYYENYNQERI